MASGAMLCGTLFGAVFFGLTAFLAQREERFQILWIWLSGLFSGWVILLLVKAMEA